MYVANKVINVSGFNRCLSLHVLQALMIGDDVANDVGGAQKCGLAGVLVRTGKYR